jgi:hydrogenase nickel incorporation protein HypA/HybF
MHEGSLVKSLLRQVQDLAAAQGGGAVGEIRIEVGLLAGVEPLLLQEAFRRERAGTVAGDAALFIDAVGLTCHCRGCQLNYTTDVLQFVCPACGARHVDVVAGDCVVLHSFTLKQPAKA